MVLARLNNGCRNGTPVRERPLHPTPSHLTPEASQTQAPVTPRDRAGATRRWRLNTALAMIVRILFLTTLLLCAPAAPAPAMPEQHGGDTDARCRDWGSLPQPSSGSAARELPPYRAEFMSATGQPIRSS